MKFWLLNILTGLYIILVIFYVPNYAWIAITLALTMYTLILVYVVSTIQLNFFFKSINNSNNRGVVLSFDDGPNTYTLDILEILKKHDVKAVFFIIGSSIEGNETVVAQIKKEGHLIGNHSYSHQNSFPFMSPKKVEEEINNTNAKLIELGINSDLFRPPFGVCNPRVAQGIKRTKMKSIGWNLRPYDTKVKSSDELLRKLLKRVNKNSLILLHDSQKVTVDMLDSFIVEVKRNGLKFVNLEA